MELHFGTIAHVRANPFESENSLEILEDGALLLDENGKIVGVGSRSGVTAVKAKHIDHGSAWILPGFIDGHIHFPQFYATASYGKELLDWLVNSIFPSEAKFADEAYASRTAKAFVKHLLASGTTTALVFGSQFPQATRALFEEAKAAGLRLLTGLTLMDMNGPESILIKPDRVIELSQSLIELVADEPRLDYVITPRFAPACSREMLSVCGDLVQRFPECYVQTHINESLGELDLVKRDFADFDHYLGVYDHFGLVGPKSVLAHSIYTLNSELELMVERGNSVCHCPASNLYLGSGLFSLENHVNHKIPVLIGTDVGAGTEFSIQSELSYVYKVQQMNHFRMDAAKLLYLGTLAGAEALHIADQTGSFTPGKDADFLIIDPSADAYLNERLKHCKTLEDQLFVLLNLGGPQLLTETVTLGKRRVGTHQG